jgi:hypothetical protein
MKADRESSGHTFIVRPRIRVCQGDQLLVHPRKQTDGGIRKAVTNGLWFCRLLGKVAHATFNKIHRVREGLFLAGIEKRVEHAFEERQRVLVELDEFEAVFFCFSNHQVMDVAVAWKVGLHGHVRVRCLNVCRAIFRGSHQR